MELSFANGVQEYTVHGVKGDVVIRFNPTDGAFIQRLYNAFDTLDKKQEKYADEVQKCGDRVEIFNIADRRDKEMFIFGYDIVLDRLERVIHQLVELQTAE